MLCCHGITIPTELKLYCVLGVTKTLRIDAVDKILSKLLYFHRDYHHFCSTVAQYNSPWAAETGPADLEQWNLCCSFFCPFPLSEKSSSFIAGKAAS